MSLYTVYICREGGGRLILMIHLFTCKNHVRKQYIKAFIIVSTKTHTVRQVRQGQGGDLGLETGQYCGVRQHCHQGKENGVRSNTSTGGRRQVC